MFITDTRKIVPKKREISNKKLNEASNSKNNPPKNGPVRLPILKKIPQRRFPVGSNSVGVKSDIYEIPSENMDPTNNPAMKKVPITRNVEASNKLAAKNAVAPPPSAMRNTGRLPIRSESIPSGICETIPPAENVANIIETEDTLIPLRSA